MPIVAILLPQDPGVDRALRTFWDNARKEISVH